MEINVHTNTEFNTTVTKNNRQNMECHRYKKSNPLFEIPSLQTFSGGSNFAPDFPKMKILGWILFWVFYPCTPPSAKFVLLFSEFGVLDFSIREFILRHGFPECMGRGVVKSTKVLLQFV